MGSEGFLVLGVGIVLGFGMVKLFFKTKFGKKLMKNRNPRDRVLNNPDLLVKKLTEGKGFIDEGRDMNFSVIEEDGVKKVKLELGEERKPKPKPKPILKKKPKAKSSKNRKV